MSLNEIHEQQRANNLEAIGPLLASYAESYFGLSLENLIVPTDWKLK